AAEGRAADPGDRRRLPDGVRAGRRLRRHLDHHRADPDRGAPQRGPRVPANARDEPAAIHRARDRRARRADPARARPRAAHGRGRGLAPRVDPRSRRVPRRHGPLPCRARLGRRRRRRRTPGRGGRSRHRGEHMVRAPRLDGRGAQDGRGMTTTVASANRGTGAATGPVIECDGLVKIFKVADLEVVALQGLDLIVDRGEFVAIVGASGSGKSTLLSILGGMEVPSAGRVVVDGHLVAEMDAAERTAYRRSVLGFIWQQTARNLLPYLNARENVELPMLLEGGSRKQRRARSTELLELVGLTDRAEHRPGMLSGGEQQRVAIAVALANEPAIL